MCMPGSTSEDCSDCITIGSDGLIQSCTNQIEVSSWPGDPTLGLVRYSNTDQVPSILVTKSRDINLNLTEFRSMCMIDAASTVKSTSYSNNNHYTADVAGLTPFSNSYGLI